MGIRQDVSQLQVTVAELLARLDRLEAKRPAAKSRPPAEDE